MAKTKPQPADQPEPTPEQDDEATVLHPEGAVIDPLEGNV